MLRALAAIVVPLIFASAVYDSINDGHSWLETALVGAVAIIPPLSAYLIALWVRSRMGRRWVVEGAASLVLLAGATLYLFYAMNGPTDPDTAGHLHFYLAPVLYLILVSIVLGPFGILALLRPSRSNHTVERDARKSGARPSL